MYKLILILFLLSACNEKIVSDLDEVKANQILIALNKYGVDAKKIKTGANWGVEVQKKQISMALEVLSLGRFLSTREQEEPSSSFVKSKVELEHFLERKLSRSLEETLEKMPNVLEARVHISASDLPEFSREKIEKTASVLLVLEFGGALDIAKVQQLISGASGLEEQKVKVVTEYAQQLNPIIKKEIKMDKNKVVFSLIPVLASCLVLVKRYESLKKRNSEVKKILKKQDE